MKKVETVLGLKFLLMVFVVLAMTKKNIENSAVEDPSLGELPAEKYYEHILEDYISLSKSMREVAPSESFCLHTRFFSMFNIRRGFGEINFSVIGCLRKQLFLYTKPLYPEC